MMTWAKQLGDNKSMGAIPLIFFIFCGIIYIENEKRSERNGKIFYDGWC